MPKYTIDNSTPDLYVGCPVGGINPRQLIFLRRFSDNGSSISLTEIAKLDPNNYDDALIVHGTELKGQLLRKLADATQLRNIQGSLAVNSRGAVVIGIIATNQWYKPIDDAIFNWSSYGVTVPGGCNPSSCCT